MKLKKRILNHKFVLIVSFLLSQGFFNTNFYFAKEVNITFPKIYVPDPDLPTEIILEGGLTFENDWLFDLLGRDNLNIIELKILAGKIIIGTASIFVVEGENKVTWQLKVDLTSLSKDLYNAVVNGKDFNLILYFEEYELWRFK